MKKTRIYYWIVTGVFSIFMLFSAIPDVLMIPEAMIFITALGYPEYFVPFIGVVKILGVIALLVPGFGGIKEWAYAGFFFELSGAVYSLIVMQGFQIQMVVLLLPIGFLFWSYWLFHKINSLTKQKSYI